jgi:putative spermidine/putrescine transport system permease protein
MTKRDHRLAIALLLLPAVGYVALFIAAVLGMTVLQSFGFFSFGSATKVGIENWVTVLSDRQSWDSFSYSARIAVLSAFGSLLVAYPLALYLRGTFLAKGLTNTILRIPLFVPGLVAAFLILNILSFHGIVNEVLLMLGIIKEPFRLTHDASGLVVIAIQIWKNVPFQTIILTAALVSIPADLEAAARNLGAGPFAVFRHIVFPLAMPGVVTGVTLIFIGVFGDYAINSIAGPIYPVSLAIRMYLLSHSFGEWGQAGVTAIAIMLASLLFAAVFSRLANGLGRRAAW